MASPSRRTMSFTFRAACGIVSRMAKPDFDIAALTPAERLMLAQQLLDSLRPEAHELSEAQLAEMERRAADIDSGAVALQPWEALRDAGV